MSTRRSYTDAEVRKALEIHAAVSGRQDLVARMLKDEGLTMTVATVRDWATRRHRDLYADIRQGISTTIQITASDRYKAVTGRALDVMDEALRQTAEALRRGEIQPKDLPKVAQNAAVSAGIGTDKSQLLDGEPTAIVSGSTTAVEAARELESVGMVIYVPTSAGPRPLTEVMAPTSGLPEHVDDQRGKDAASEVGS
jgi:hypothetical protein